MWVSLNTQCLARPADAAKHCGGKPRGAAGGVSPRYKVASKVLIGLAFALPFPHFVLMAQAYGTTGKGLLTKWRRFPTQVVQAFGLSGANLIKVPPPAPHFCILCVLLAQAMPPKFSLHRSHRKPAPVHPQACATQNHPSK